MSTIITAKYLFVLSTGTSKSRKEIELQDAEARAHAARHSHRKRKSIKSLVKRPPARPSSETSSEEDEEAALFLRVLSRASSGHGGLSVRIGQGRGDPFDAYALKPVPPYVHELLDFGIFTSIPSSPPFSHHLMLLLLTLLLTDALHSHPLDMARSLPRRRPRPCHQILYANHCRIPRRPPRLSIRANSQHPNPQLPE
jgi:hypothetical protein